MDKCAKCGADRSLVGVRFPARRLCRCEVGRPCGENNCASPAAVVEFQSPVKDASPDAPARSGKQAKLLCEGHAPVEFALADMPEAPPRRRRLASNVDPQWGHDRPPPGALSSARVQCWSCKDTHKLKDRRMHNGSMSTCPKCGDDMTVNTDEEDAA